MPRGRRLLYALTPAVLVLLIAVSPAVHVQDEAHRAALGRTATIRDVDASLAGLSAAIAERVPVPSVWPMQAPATGLAALALLSWLGAAVATVLVLDRVGRTRRDRAPPRLGLLVRV